MYVSIVNVIIIQDDKILLVQQRKKSAYGLWSFPGGHVEAGESLMRAIMREVKEEIGVVLHDPTYMNEIEFESEEGTLRYHTYRGTISERIILKDDELLAYGWFSLESLETMKPVLRTPYIFSKSQEALTTQNTIKLIA